MFLFCTVVLFFSFAETVEHHLHLNTLAQRRKKNMPSFKEDNVQPMDAWENSELMATWRTSANGLAASPLCYSIGECDLVALQSTTDQDTSLGRNFVMSVFNGKDGKTNDQLKGTDLKEKFFGVCRTPVPGRPDSLQRYRGLSVAVGGIYTVVNKDENQVMIKAGEFLKVALTVVHENGSDKLMLTFVKANAGEEALIRARALSDASYKQQYQVKLLM